MQDSMTHGCPNGFCLIKLLDTALLPPRLQDFRAITHLLAECEYLSEESHQRGSGESMYHAHLLCSRSGLTGSLQVTFVSP